jgi:glycosyltransferase involved in cell wall biosynthesis
MGGPRRLLIASQPLSAGVPRHVVDLVDGIDPERWTVDVVCPKESVLWRALAGRGGVHLHGMSAARGPSSSDVASLARLTRLARRADVIHVHSAKAGFVGRLAAALAGKSRRCLFTPHAWSFWAAEGARRAVYLRLERGAARWCRVIVAVSQAERDAGLRAGVGRPGQYRVVANGIDVQRFRVPRNPVPGRILVLGRLTRQKRPDLAVRAFARLDLPGAELHLANDGPDRERVEALARTLGVADRVRFLGYQQDVPALLARASCLLLTSEYEAASLSLLEAMAAGVPVVATRVGGVEEALDGAGVVVPPGDEAAIAAALARVLGDAAEAARLAEAARERVGRLFTRERMVAETVALYDEIAA